MRVPVVRKVSTIDRGNFDSHSEVVLIEALISNSSRNLLLPGYTHGKERKQNLITF